MALIFPSSWWRGAQIHLAPISTWMAKWMVMISHVCSISGARRKDPALLHSVIAFTCVRTKQTARPVAGAGGVCYEIESSQPIQNLFTQ
jgi:phosphatidylserine decarboxylase